MASGGCASSADEVDWLECISAIESNQGLLYFCDVGYGKTKNLPVLSSFKSTFPEGTTLYSITAYNPYNQITNRIVNELANCELINDMRKFLPGCNIFNNFSFFPSRPHHFERGFTVQVPKDYMIYNHGMIIYSLCIKYQQAAFFKGIVLKNGFTVPYVVLVQGEYTEIREELVSIGNVPTHPAFLHRANHAVFRDLSHVLTVLHQTRGNNELSNSLLEIFYQHFIPISTETKKCPIIAVEGRHSTETGLTVSKLLDAEFLGNTPKCMKDLEEKFKCSTVLLSAYKTIADYIQASKIAQKAEQKMVIVNKYWSNTAASLIVCEVNKGQRNLPPRDHEVYQWPKGLLKPDATVLISKKTKREKAAEQHKLKDSALKRMKDADWIAVCCGGRPKGDFVSSQIVDKLKENGIIKMRMVDALCPASHMPTISITDVQPDNYVSDEQKATTTCSEEGKPFWF